MAGKHFLTGLLSTLAALSVALPAPVMAQGTPDLTGSWIVDTAKSDPAPPGRGGAGFGRGGGNPLLYKDQDDARLNLTSLQALGIGCGS